MKNKFCSKCKIKKELSDFGNDKTRKDGKYIFCKVCTKEIMKNVRKKNNKKRTEYNKKYRSENREKYNKWERNYYYKNKKKMDEKSKKWRNEKGNLIVMHLSAKLRAKRKNIPYELNSEIIESFIIKQNNRCILTNIKFDFNSSKYRYRPFAPSIDRIDNSKGYAIDNIQIVCCIVNKAKNEYSLEIFDKMCLARCEVLNGSKI